MALITCTKCGSSVSDKADACPICGKSVKSIIAEINGETPEPEAELKQAEANAAKKKPIAAIASGAAVIALAVVGLVVIGITRQTPSKKLDKIDHMIAQREYSGAYAQCVKLIDKEGKLSDGECIRLLGQMNSVAYLSGDGSFKSKYNEFFKHLYYGNASLASRLAESFTDSYVQLALPEAISDYKEGRFGSAKTICNLITSQFYDLSLKDRCTVVSLMAAIGKAEGDSKLLSEASTYYKNTMSWDTAEARKHFNANDKSLNIKISNILSSGKSSSVATVPMDAVPAISYSVTSSRKLTESDIWGLSRADLRLIRNEIYARHGYVFASADLTNYFNQYSWYYPISKDVIKNLSSIETYNIAFIKKHE